MNLCRLMFSFICFSIHRNSLCCLSCIEIFLHTFSSVGTKDQTETIHDNPVLSLKCQPNVRNYTYIRFVQGSILLEILVADSRERKLRVQEEEPAIDMGEGLALVWPIGMTCGGEKNSSSAFHAFENRDFTLKQRKNTFEGCPDRKISQSEGMPN